MARDNHLRIDTVAVAAGADDLTGHAGLLAIVTFLERTGIIRLVRQRLPATMSANGYSAADILLTIWVNILVHRGAATLQTIDHLRANPAVLRLLKMKQMPSATTVGDWLRRMANVERTTEDGVPVYDGYADGLTRMQNCMYEITLLTLKRLRALLPDVLDYDAVTILEEKAYDMKMYTGEWGSMAYCAFVGRVCVMAEIEPGNHSPNDKVVRRMLSVMRLCNKAGVWPRGTRADSASYIGALFDWCVSRGVTFYMRTDQDAAVRETNRAITAWNMIDVRQAKAAQKKEICVGRSVHAMGTAEHAFTLVTQRTTEITQPAPGDLAPETPSIVHRYSSIATNDPQLSDAAVIEFYNARGEEENRHKELKDDFGLKRLPCRGPKGLAPNRIYGYACVMLYNLMEIYKKECLGVETMTLRLPTIRERFIALPAKVTLHGHTLTVTLARGAQEQAWWLEDLVQLMRQELKAWVVPVVAPMLWASIYRRE
ncbi:MAG: IS1380 family transposase [bacterium]|nr:IS1380 family transposase [bacterium]